MTEVKTFVKQRFSEMYSRQKSIKKSIGTVPSSSGPWDVRELTVRLMTVTWLGEQVSGLKRKLPSREEGKLYPLPYPGDSSLFSPIHVWYSVGA